MIKDENCLEVVMEVAGFSQHSPICYVRNSSDGLVRSCSMMQVDEKRPDRSNM